MSVEDKFTFSIGLDIVNETTGKKIHDTPSMNWYNLSYEDVVMMEDSLIGWLQVLNDSAKQVIADSKAKKV